MFCLGFAISTGKTGFDTFSPNVPFLLENTVLTRLKRIIPFLLQIKGYVYYSLLAAKINVLMPFFLFRMIAGNYWENKHLLADLAWALTGSGQPFTMLHLANMLT